MIQFTAWLALWNCFELTFIGVHQGEVLSVCVCVCVWCVWCVCVCVCVCACACMCVPRVASLL